MLSNTRNNVNDRISNRVDSTACGLAELLLRYRHGTRCYLHQVCVILGLESFYLRAAASGHKRLQEAHTAWQRSASIWLRMGLTLPTPIDVAARFSRPRLFVG